jgi:prophage maintenance system killer protein
MLTFLELNGYALGATDRELANWIISFNAGAKPTDVAERVRPRLVLAS